MLVQHDDIIKYMLVYQHVAWVALCVYVSSTSTSYYNMGRKNMRGKFLFFATSILYCFCMLYILWVRGCTYVHTSESRIESHACMAGGRVAMLLA